ncbi:MULTISPECIES: glycosyltransferase family 2 protein [unclassified Campylobacter]|uniref:glycosyltransferase family 2 protein n=1 Tax=unclassified Campylobacter TaxID=2593542 RepID=UPI001475063F|nr:glycosyltransferase family 2 protein [Campylobacter sp. RM9328]MBE3021419.1 glycosyltransferase family 2 protein [Campylobacter sp. 7477a]
MIKASVYMICMNEQRHIRRALEAVKDFDEIVVVDSGSSDETVQIAKEYTDKVIYKKWEGEGIQKAYALAQCTNKWVLNIDADEEVTPELKREIVELMKQDEYGALDIPFHEYSLGKICHDKVRKNTHIRFFKKENARYTNMGVHAQVEIFDTKIKRSKGTIHHFSDKFIHELVMKNNNYSTLRAEQKAGKKNKSSFLKLLFIYPLTFFKSYFLRRSFYDGKKGFITANINAFYAFMKEAKLYELDNFKGKQ